MTAEYSSNTKQVFACGATGWYFMARQLADLIRQTKDEESSRLFRFIDENHQKEAMLKLTYGMKKPDELGFIKANTITNKAVSNMYGCHKMLMKNEMSLEMLTDRIFVLEDVVNLMCTADKFDLDISISEHIYKLYH